MNDRDSSSETAEPSVSKASLPERVVVDANGAYWRDYGEFYSMCPVSTDNDPIDIVAVYELGRDASAAGSRQDGQGNPSGHRSVGERQGRQPAQDFTATTILRLAQGLRLLRDTGGECTRDIAQAALDACGIADPPEEDHP